MPIEETGSIFCLSGHLIIQNMTININPIHAMIAVMKIWKYGSGATTIHTVYHLNGKLIRPHTMPGVGPVKSCNE